MKARFHLLILLVVSLLVFPVSGTEKASAQSSTTAVKIPEIVARVNGVDIPSKYIQFRLSKILKSVRRPLTLSEKTSVVQDLIEKEVVRELIQQQGEKKNLKVDPELIEKEIKALREPYASDEEFEKAMKARNITLEDLKKSMEIDINARKLLNKQIKGKINISNENVKKYYEDNKPKFHRPESYRVRHILSAIFPGELVKSTPVSELQSKKEELTRKAEEKIDTVINLLNEGADFKELAKEKSDDEGSRDKGGDLGTIYKGVLDPAFDEAVSKLKPGETSGKVQTRFGFHAIQIIEKHPPEDASFEEMEKAIQKYLFTEEAKKLVENYIEGLRKQAKIKNFFN